MIILLIEDDKYCRDLIRLHLLKFKNVFYNLDIHEAETLKEGLKAVEDYDPNMILLDGDLPDSAIQETVTHIPKIVANAAVVILTDHENIDMVVTAMKNGAQDYISKKLLADGKEFVSTLTTAWSRFEGRKIKETNLLSSPRIKQVTKELIEMARQDMTIDELKGLVEFSNYARSNFDEFQKKVDKMYKSIYESNGTPSIKQQIFYLTEGFDKFIKQNNKDKEEIKNEKKAISIANITGKWQFWVVAAPLIIAPLVSYILEWVKIFSSSVGK